MEISYIGAEPKKILWSNSGCFNGIETCYSLSDDEVRLIELSDVYLVKTEFGYAVVDGEFNVFMESLISRCGWDGQPRVRMPKKFYKANNDGSHRVYEFSKNSISYLNPEIEIDTAFFLGTIHKEFGHQITECLSRLHVYGTGEDQPRHPILISNLLSNNAYLKVLSLFGIDERRLLVIPDNKIIKVKKLLLPTQAMHLFGRYSHKMKSIWSKIYTSSKKEALESPKKIFLARSSNRRKSIGAEEVQNFFEKNGFHIIYPEKYDISQQISMVGSANFVAGYVGSQMHLSQFMSHGNTLILGSNIFFPSDFVCSAILNSQNLQAILADCNHINEDSVLEHEFRISLNELKKNLSMTF